MVIDQFRIYLTENCNANCPFCINANSRSKQNMDFDRYVKLCEYLSKNGVLGLKILGGEPTEHPDFVEMWNIAQSMFKTVGLFTNGLNKDKLEKIKLVNDDGVVINYNFIKNDGTDFLFDNSDQSVSRRFSVIINSKTDYISLCDKIIKTNHIMKSKRFPNYRFNLTLDCSENIFLEENFIKYSEALYNVFLTCINNNIPFRLDNKMPMCALSSKNTELLDKFNIRHSHVCNYLDGVITADFNLTGCLNYHENKLGLFDNNNEITINFHDIQRWLLHQQFIRLERVAKTKCIDCMNFIDLGCNSGCWGHKFEDRFDCPNLYWKNTYKEI